MEKFFQTTKLVPVDHDPFASGAIEEAVPTTEPQREVFLAASMGRDASCAYNESVSLELEGALDRAALEQAMDQLIVRHEGLRSVISASGTRVIIQPEAKLPLTFTDLASAAPAEQQAALDAIAREDMTTAFDMINGPVFRAHLIRLAPEKHTLRLTGHHVLVDGWSLGIIMADVSKLYTALIDRSAPALEPAVTLGEYATATIDFAKSEEQLSTERYWLEQFKGAVPRMDLPADRTRPRQKTFNGHRLDLEMDAALVQRLKEVATRSGASFVTTLLTSFELLMSKLTEQADIVVGLPAAGQSDMGMKNLVSHCVNLLALRSNVDSSKGFIDHLKERRTAVLDAFDHQKYTFGTLLRTLSIPREPGRIPLVPVVFNIDMNMDDGVHFQGLRHRFVSNARHYENFELFLNATGKEDHLILEWSYNTDLFDESTIRNWMNEFVRLVDRISTNGSATIEELLGEDAITSDRELPPVEWTGTSPDYPREKSISRLWDEVVIRFGDRTALELADIKLTYTELDARVHAVTAALLAAGVRPGDPVGLCMDRGFGMIAAMLATLRCGAAFVPFDPSYPADRLRFMFNDTQVGVLLTQRTLVDALPEHQARIVMVDELPSAASPTTAIGTPDSPAYVMYTSGSTGRPKGVVIPQRGIVRLVKAQNFLPFGHDLTFLQLSNISFDASTLEIWGALLNGGRLVLQPQQKPTLMEIIDTIHRTGVTTVWFTAGLFNLMVDEHVDRLRGLRHILTGGDVLSVPHVKKALKVLGPGVLINGYGPTENTTFTCCYRIDDESRIRSSVPIGQPINHTTVHVLDSGMMPVGVGQKGELYTGGDGLAIGYWKREDLNAERFVIDPATRKRLYRTGDIVRWGADGLIEFIGRADDQVKVRGFRIELGEIETALNGHALIKDRVVVVRSDGPGASSGGVAEKQLVCYVVPHASQTAHDDEERDKLIATVREHLRERLPDHMIPTAFVVMERFPLNPNGKVDKKALPAPVRQMMLRAQHVAPRDHNERVLASMWSQLLSVENVGVHDNFFELGGHSLIAIQLFTLIEQQFDRTFALKTLFQAPTIAEFAILLKERGAAVQWTNLSPIQPEGTRPPLFCVHGDEANYFIPRYLGNDQPFYAFFHQGEDGLAIRFTQVEEIAAHFITEMKSVRPSGPYFLSGFSFGGIVAYEMAQQLSAQGEKVALLALLDTYAPSEFMAVMKQEAKVYDGLKKWIMRRLAKYFLDRKKPLPPKLRHFYIIDTYDKAIRAYVPKHYDGEITVLKAERSIGAPEMGWDKHGRVEVVRVPGDHYSMIKEPDVRGLVSAIGACIDRRIAIRAVEAV